MNGRRSRTLPIPHLFMLASVLIVTVMALTAEVNAEVVEGSCDGAVMMNGEPVIDEGRSASMPAVIADSGTVQIEGSFDSPEVDATEP